MNGMQEMRNRMKCSLSCVAISWLESYGLIKRTTASKAVSSIFACVRNCLDSYGLRNINFLIDIAFPCVVEFSIRFRPLVFHCCG